MDFLKAYEELKELFGESAAKKLVELLSEMRESLMREEFDRLRAALDELRESHEKTNEELRKLAEAQRKTEEELSKLATRVDQLGKTVDQLAETVAQLTKRVDQLTERIDQLAEAQRRTEEELRVVITRVDRLTDRLDFTIERLEGLSDTVGYTLENQAFKSLPALLRRDFGIEVIGRLVRRYVALADGRVRQVNIYGRGRRDGQELLIIGECKVRPSRREVHRLAKLADELEKAEGIEVFKVMVCHDFPPEMENLIEELGIKGYWSYELE
ncbi:hypothetical protein DRP77_12765 [Candidatus Poribacteria bacterium]|nr:MAG: hypothetical protein DRP77_12765 [Candidatus Poribacteria bacterium]